MNVTDAGHKQAGDMMIQSLCDMINSGLICGDIVCCLLHYAMLCYAVLQEVILICMKSTVVNNFSSFIKRQFYIHKHC